MNYPNIYILLCLAVAITILGAKSVSGQSLSKTDEVAQNTAQSDVLILSASVHFNFEAERINRRTEKGSLGALPAVRYQNDDNGKRKKFWWIVGGAATLVVGSAAILLTGSDGSSGEYIPVPPGRPIP